MKHIDKLFKEKLYNHEAPVPEGMWEKIAPIAEEESGRALLWFWLAGALTLLLGGYGIYKMMSSDPSQDPNTLAFEEQIIDGGPETSISTSLVFSEEDSQPIKNINADDKPNVEKKSNTKRNKIKTSTSKNKPTGVSNTVETIANVSGMPANLVITKSYINKEGSIIKQSNLSENIGKDAPVYDVIINSEAKDVNAGALLRIIEPLENIPLPSLHKQLKKKKTVALY